MDRDNLKHREPWEPVHTFRGLMAGLLYSLIMLGTILVILLAFGPR